jgi:hypothetical protein
MTQRCRAGLDARGKRCKNRTSRASGLCHVHDGGERLVRCFRCGKRKPRNFDADRFAGHCRECSAIVRTKLS